MEETNQIRLFTEGKLDSGSFKTYLIKAVLAADFNNLGKLHKGFPKLVEDYCEYSGNSLERVLEKPDEDFTQLCVWPGTIVAKGKTEEEKKTQIKSFEEFFKDQFDTRIKYESEVATLSDGNPGSTGGRNDAFFYVHKDDVRKFAAPRLKASIRWWEDVFFNQQENIYPEEFRKTHPRTW